MKNRELYGGLIRPQLLHAAEGPIYGLSTIDELRGHGYRLSPGTPYPILHGLETKGYLCLVEKRLGRTARGMYRITPSGRSALTTAKRGELFANSPAP